jgi:hypothetical protein
MEEGSIADGMSANNLTVALKPSETLTARMDWVHRHQEDCRKRTRLLWKWSSPFISYASGLHHLTEIRAPEISGAEVGLAHSKNPLYAAIEIELINHPGFIVHPKYIVGISGNIQIRSYWRIFSLHSWVSGWFRYISFYGTGRIYISGYGYVRKTVPDGSVSSVNPSLIVGFDGRLEYKISRTETFVPYWKKLRPLMNDSFAGNYPFFYQGAFTDDIKNKQIDDNPVWQIIGRVLGF